VTNREGATFVCSHVFDNSRPILLVARENGDWMHLCGQPHEDNEEYHVVGVEHLLERDPTLHEVSDLPSNDEAERPAIGMPWSRRQLTSDQ
jgi:hypothetical protein